MPLPNGSSSEELTADQLLSQRLEIIEGKLDGKHKGTAQTFLDDLVFGKSNKAYIEAVEGLSSMTQYEVNRFFEEDMPQNQSIDEQFEAYRQADRESRLNDMKIRRVCSIIKEPKRFPAIKAFLENVRVQDPSLHERLLGSMYTAKKDELMSAIEGIGNLSENDQVDLEKIAEVAQNTILKYKQKQEIASETEVAPETQLDEPEAQGISPLGHAFIMFSLINVEMIKKGVTNAFGAATDIADIWALAAQNDVWRRPSKATYEVNPFEKIEHGVRKAFALVGMFITLFVSDKDDRKLYQDALLAQEKEYNKQRGDLEGRTKSIFDGIFTGSSAADAREQEERLAAIIDDSSDYRGGRHNPIGGGDFGQNGIGVH